GLRRRLRCAPVPTPTDSGAVVLPGLRRGALPSGGPGLESPAVAMTKVGDRADRSGELLGGRYRIERLVGIGAMGSIWAVRDASSGLEAVAKVHEAELADASDPIARERFLREAVALASVRHPNVVSLLEVGQTEAGEPFLIMERLVGEPLDERLWRGRPTVS